MLNIAKTSINYNINENYPCYETIQFISADKTDWRNYEVEFDYSDNELGLTLSKEESILYDELLIKSSRIGEIVGYAERGISIFPANTKFTIEDATADFKQLAEMWSEYPDAKVAIPTGCRFGIVAIRFDEFLSLLGVVFDLKPPCKSPISKRDWDTWRLKKYSPKWIEREEYVNRMMSLYERAISEKRDSTANQIRSEMSNRCKEYGEDEDFLIFRVERSDELRLLSFDGFYGDDSFLIDEGDWTYFNTLIENENCPPRILPKRIFDFLANKSISETIEQFSFESDDDFHYSKSDSNIESLKIEECNDLGNSRRFVRQHGQDVLFSVERKKWLVYDGRRWKPDDSLNVQLRAKQTAISIASEASLVPADSNYEKEFDKLLKHAQKTKHAKAIKDMLTMAESDLAIQENKFNKDKMLLNCANGTIDLRNGKLRPHESKDYVSKLVDVNYEPNAKCPTWITFLNRIMNGNQSLISFLQRAVGYSLTGEVNERAVFVLHGNGANGKSVFTETIKEMLGDYAVVSPDSVVMKKQNGSASNDLAKLKDARFVSINETDENGRINESTIKAISGNDTLTARHLYAEFFDFKPQFKMWMRTNHKPNVTGTDEGIWDRLKLIPFAVRIPKHEQNRNLQNELKKELSGILAWAVRGCLDWQKHGLGLPNEIEQATNQYRKEQDTFAIFVNECCVLVEDGWTSSADLRLEFERFCKERGEHSNISGNAFGERLKAIGCVQKPTRKGRGWSGIGLLIPQ